MAADCSLYVVGETPFKYYVEDEIQSFRDALLGLFFVTIGTQFHAPTIVASWETVALLLLNILICKPLPVMAHAPRSDLAIGYQSRARR